jgi:putative ABC transport system permease protein
MNQWLQSFGYRIEMQIGTYLLSGFIALAVAISTVSYHAIKASRSNPIDAVRNE